MLRLNGRWLDHRRGCRRRRVDKLADVAEKLASSQRLAVRGDPSRRRRCTRCDHTTRRPIEAAVGDGRGDPVLCRRSSRDATKGVLNCGERSSSRLACSLGLGSKLDSPVSSVLGDRRRDVALTLLLSRAARVEIALREQELLACLLDGTTLRPERLARASTSSGLLDVFTFGGVDALPSGSDLLCRLACPVAQLARVSDRPLDLTRTRERRDVVDADLRRTRSEPDVPQVDAVEIDTVRRQVRRSSEALVDLLVRRRAHDVRSTAAASDPDRAFLLSETTRRVHGTAKRNPKQIVDLAVHARPDALRMTRFMP